MKITRITLYQVDLPLLEGSYNWSGGKSVRVFDSTVVRLETDTEHVGWGEACPLGPAYLPAYAEGVRTGIQRIGPGLLGLDPLLLGPLNERMDAALKGHAYVKTALDMACWDILGKASRQPLSTLLGGRQSEQIDLYRAISQESPEKMAERVSAYRAEGYRKFQLKVGGRPEDDIERIRAVRSVLERGDLLIADANTGWLAHEALRVVRAVADLDVYIEQPCAAYEECLAVRRRTSHPFVLDECIDSVASLIRAAHDQAADAVNIKISKLGGLTRARQARDLAVSMGLGVTIEDSWGGDIITTAIAHLAQSTPPQFLLSSTDFNSYVTVQTARNAPRRVGGQMTAPTAPGLGIEPIPEALGSPVADIVSG